MTDANEIAQAVAEALKPHVSVKPMLGSSAGILLRRPGDACVSTLVQVGTLEIGPIEPRKLAGIVARLREHLPAVCSGFKDLPKPKGSHEAAFGYAGDVRLRVVRAYDFDTDDFLTRVDVLVAL